LRLAHDEAMPYQPVLDSLEALDERFPTVEVQLASARKGMSRASYWSDALISALLFHHEQMPEELERRVLGSVEMVTVCAVDHPLASEPLITRQQLARHRQLLIAPQQSGYPGGEQLSPQVWRADSFYVMAELLMRGLGLGLAAAPCGAIPGLSEPDDRAEQ
jgi:DNA-binding transcriptional LysR family regulator